MFLKLSKRGFVVWRFGVAGARRPGPCGRNSIPQSDIQGQNPELLGGLLPRLKPGRPSFAKATAGRRAPAKRYGFAVGGAAVWCSRGAAPEEKTKQLTVELGIDPAPFGSAKLALTGENGIRSIPRCRGRFVS